MRQQAKPAPEEKGGEAKRVPKGALPMLCFSACLLVFFTLLFEFAHVFANAIPGGNPYDTYVTCMARFAGLLCGGIALQVPCVRAFAARHGRGFALALVGVLAALAAMTDAGLMTGWHLGTVCVLCIAAGADMAMLLVLCIACLKDLDVRLVACGLAACVAACAVAEVAELAVHRFMPPWPALMAIHLSFCVAALLVEARWRSLSSHFPTALARDLADGREKDGECAGCAPTSAPASAHDPAALSNRTSAEGAWHARLRARLAGARAAGMRLEDVRRFPWQPAMSLLCYGFTFGFLHTTLGFFQLLGSNRLTFSFAGSLLGAVLLLATYAQPVPTAREVWTNLRRLAFPLATGLVMIPALLHDYSSWLFLHASSCYWGGLLVLACLFAMRQCDIPATRIVAFGLAFAGLGVVIGSLAAFEPYDPSRLHDYGDLSARMLVAFVIATVGTFWIGDDHALRTWWGLRRNYTAKQYHDELARRKCAAVARKYGLSDREEEVLLLLIQGRRASQIKDDLTISINTVRVHIRNIYVKLDAHSVKQAADIVEKIFPPEAGANAENAAAEKQHRS